MLIQVTHIHFTYPGGVKVLDDISLVIQPGEKVALVGENGSGKSTLARHLNSKNLDLAAVAAAAIYPVNVHRTTDIL